MWLFADVWIMSAGCLQWLHKLNHYWTLLQLSVNFKLRVRNELKPTCIRASNPCLVEVEQHCFMWQVYTTPVTKRAAVARYWATDSCDMNSMFYGLKSVLWAKFQPSKTRGPCFPNQRCWYFMRWKSVAKTDVFQGTWKTCNFMDFSHKHYYGQRLVVAFDGPAVRCSFGTARDWGSIPYRGTNFFFELLIDTYPTHCYIWWPMWSLSSKCMRTCFLLGRVNVMAVSGLMV